jgi:cytochrome P450
VLLSHPGLQARLLEGGDATIRQFVEEVIRLFSTAEWTRRWAKRDTELGGVQIKKGDHVIAISAAANRDPSRYECPSDVDLERSAPRDHFGFFQGPRICPGQSLARFQLERVFAVATQRLPELRLNPNAEPPKYSGLMVRRWEPLHAFFSATA